MRIGERERAQGWRETGDRDLLDCIVQFTYGGELLGDLYLQNRRRVTCHLVIFCWSREGGGVYWNVIMNVLLRPTCTLWVGERGRGGGCRLGRCKKKGSVALARTSPSLSLPPLSDRVGGGVKLGLVSAAVDTVLPVLRVPFSGEILLLFLKSRCGSWS
jgi:hypothetical protein